MYILTVNERGLFKKISLDEILFNKGVDRAVKQIEKAASLLEPYDDEQELENEDESFLCYHKACDGWKCPCECHDEEDYCDETE